ncbi:alpha/beta fold hydrolase [Lapillicoccus jejuensis]|uniref:Alpha-beta hydrolase superfamily lysophospholipase n=1 Tax=Lapillicoccus jejuensis TaxID=402171 RepID=A0A542E661_9MICO|nr:alpha/beta hydrolase [Lapillicoccus jejuensis]TQJ10807.1 alpha-beta hydrolase superfamily lysophospholipase [Lapillicoccus jejuensis]
MTDPSAGRPRPRVVLVHGSRLSHTQWSPQVRLLEDADLDLVLPDLPGHGARVAEPFTLRRAVGAIAEAVERGDPAAPVVLVGHSLGGYAAMAYAAAFPRRLDGLLLLGSAAVPVGPGAAAYRLVARVTDAVGARRMTRVNDRVLRRLYGDVVEEAIAGGYYFTVTGDAWLEVMARCRPHQLREVTCPVVVAGGRWDQLGVDAHRFARAARDGRVVRIPGAGHAVGFDQPQALADLVREVAEASVRGRDETMGAP